MKTRWIPKDSITVEHPQGFGVAYVRQFGKGYQVVAYGFKRNNHDFNYSYRTIESVHESIENWFKSLEAHVERVANRRKALYEPHTFKAGDIVTNSWGYDQTNVDWYRIVKVSASFVWLEEVASHTEETGFMSGDSAPHVDTSDADPSKWGFVTLKDAKVTKHKALGSNVCMKYGSGSKWNGEKKYASWYA